MHSRSLWNIAYAFVIAVAVPLIVYATANIPASCTTPGDCDAITPRFESLTVKHSMSGESLYISGSGASPLIFADTTTGNVGIGATVSPSILSVQSTTGKLVDVLSSASYAQIRMTSYRNSSVTHALLEGLGARGTQSSPSPVVAGDALLSLRAGGYGTTDFDSNIKDNAAAIDFVAGSTFSDSGGIPDHSGLIVFRTATGSSYNLEKMRITSGGNVGIGVTAVNAKLEVAGTISGSELNISGDATFGAAGAFQMTSTLSDVPVSANVEMRVGNLSIESRYAGIRYNNYWDGANARFVVDNTGYGIIHNEATGNLDFLAYPSGTAGNVPDGLYTADMVFTSSGMLGIGTTSPQSRLHIPDGNYLQAEDNNAGAPANGDCDADTERGRFSIDTSNNRLYICNGASRGWDYVDLTN